MIYCVGMKLDVGLVFLLDICINVGLDNILIYCKMFFFEELGEWVIVIMIVGSLLVIQIMLGCLCEVIDDFDVDEIILIMKIGLMLQVVIMIGEMLNIICCEIVEQICELSQQVSVSMIVVGQCWGGDMWLFLIYLQGNFIEVIEDMFFLQIGEYKYGKLIFDRVVCFDISLVDV